MKSVAFWGTLVCSAASQASGDGSQYWGDGPMQLRSQSPVKSLVLTPIFRPADYQHQTTQLYTSVYGASIYAIDDEYTLDYYTVEYRIGGSWRPSPNWLIGVSFANRTTDDAHLDQISLSFHKLFGIDQNGRDKIPKHRSYVSIPKAGIEEEDFSDRSIGHQYELSVGRQLYHHHRHWLSTTLVAAYQDDENPRQGEPWDFTWQLDYQYAWQQKALYLMLGYSYSGADDLFTLGIEPRLWHWGIGYRHRFADRHQWLLEYSITEGGLEQLGEFTNAVNEINLGYRYLGRQWTFEGVIMENIKYPDNSADFALVATIKYRF